MLKSSVIVSIDDDDDDNDVGGGDDPTGSLVTTGLMSMTLSYNCLWFLLLKFLNCLMGISLIIIRKLICFL